MYTWKLPCDRLGILSDFLNFASDFAPDQLSALRLKHKTGWLSPGNPVCTSRARVNRASAAERGGPPSERHLPLRPRAGRPARAGSSPVEWHTGARRGAGLNLSGALRTRIGTERVLVCRGVKRVC